MSYNPIKGKPAQTRSGKRVEPRPDIRYGVLFPHWVGEVDGKIGRWNPYDGRFQWFDDGSDAAHGVPDRYARTSFGVMYANSAYANPRPHDLDLVGDWIGYNEAPARTGPNVLDTGYVPTPEETRNSIEQWRKAIREGK